MVSVISYTLWNLNLTRRILVKRAITYSVILGHGLMSFSVRLQKLMLTHHYANIR